MLNNLRIEVNISFRWLWLHIEIIEGAVVFKSCHRPYEAVSEQQLHFSSICLQHFTSFIFLFATFKTSMCSQSDFRSLLHKDTLGVLFVFLLRSSFIANIYVDECTIMLCIFTADNCFFLRFTI